MIGELRAQVSARAARCKPDSLFFTQTPKELDSLRLRASYCDLPAQVLGRAVSESSFEGNPMCMCVRLRLLHLDGSCPGLRFCPSGARPGKATCSRAWRTI